MGRSGASEERSEARPCILPSGCLLGRAAGLSVGKELVLVPDEGVGEDGEAVRMTMGRDDVDDDGGAV